MLFGTNKQEIRKLYFDAWSKHQNKSQILTPLETQIIDIILFHPEYIKIFESNNNHQKAYEAYSHKDYLPESGETNPFLHMGLHLSIRDQIGTDKPAGIQQLFLNLCEKTQDQHQAEHLFIEKLAEQLWLAQKNQQEFNSEDYLLELKKL